MSAPQRPFPWMFVTAFILAGALGWWLAAGKRHHGTPSSDGTTLQPGMMVHARAGDAADGCKTPEASGRLAAFQIVGAQDKVRGLLERQDCVALTPRQNFKLLALKDKLAQVLDAGSTAATPLWVPALELSATAP